MVMELSFSPVGHYLLVALAAAVLLLLLLVGPARDRLTPRRRRVLAGLRLAAVGVVLLAMLRPALVRTEVVTQSATLIVLVDGSRSMQVADAFGNRTRWEAMRSALNDAAGNVTTLGEQLELKFYLFDATARRLDVEGGRAALPEAPDGDETAIGAVLDDVLRREAGRRVVGVILLSDGAQRAWPHHDTPPQIVARRMSELGYPLYAIGFGQTGGLGQVRDVALEDLSVTDHVFVKNRLSAAAKARIEGYVNERIAVQMLFETEPGKEEVVGAAQVQATTAPQRLSVALDYVPQAAGEFKLTLRVPPQAGELVTTNNQLSTFVTVLPGGMNVLYLEGQPRIEQKFLRRALDASPDIKVDYLQLDHRKPGGGPENLAELFKPGKYDVYILGDVDSTLLGAEPLVALSVAVQRGAGLIMLGGFHSFGPGGYGQTALGDVLPVEMDRLERQNFGERIRADLHHQGRIAMRPTRLGQTQSLMRLAPGDENAKAWAALPPLEGANKFSGVKPGANVLAETAQGSPLLVAKDFAAGRVLAFAGDSTWHWWMSGQEAAHKRFWRQTVLWLARKDQAGEGSVAIQLGERRYAPGSRVEFSLLARSADGDPLPEAAFEVQVLAPDGQPAQARLERQGEAMQGVFLETRQPGDYTIVASAAHEGQPLGEARARFLVYDQDLEFDNPAADHGLLQSLAALTRGDMRAPEQLPALLEEIKEAAVALQVERQVRRTLWDRLPLLLLFVGVLAVEWYLRKRWGLV